jgi:putative GTP pyrophosphokinase
MAFTIPQFSKKQISKAGAILLDDKASLLAKSGALELLAHWRSCHAYPVNTFQSTLRSRLKKICPTALVAQRLKRTPSIIKKLQLNPGMQMARMQDVGGLRAIVDNLTQVKKLSERYLKSSLTHELVDVDDYIAHPKPSGYRSLHIIYKYKNPKNRIYNGLCVELQIRTKLQHAWATAVETIGTFLDQALKSSEGSAEWLDYFKLAGAAFAILEKSPVHEKFDGRSSDEIYADFLAETSRLDVIGKLSAFAIAANSIETKKTQGNYHLVVLNTETKSVEIQSFGQKRLQEATQAYFDAETNSSVQAVLVATDSIDALRRAYPNYFLDTRSFVQTIGRIQRIHQRY